MASQSPALLEDTRCKRVCLLCEPEDGAWVVGAYTLILGIVGILLLIAIRIWEEHVIIGPIGLVLSVLLFVAGFLLSYGLYRRQVWWLYAWFFIFGVNFIGHVALWAIVIRNTIRFLKNTQFDENHLTSVHYEQNGERLRFYIAEIAIGTACLMLSVWSLVAIGAVRRRMKANTGYILTRPFSFIVRHPRGSNAGHHTRNLSFVNFRKSSTPDPLQTLSTP